jgi:hypothetical protein
VANILSAQGGTVAWQQKNRVFASICDSGGLFERWKIIKIVDRLFRPRDQKLAKFFFEQCVFLAQMGEIVTQK